MDPEQLAEAISFLEKATGGAAPDVGVICGSGLSGLVNCLSNVKVVKYEEIPHFPSITVEGHSGELCFGNVGETSVVLMRGRFHFYEGHHMKVVTSPVKVMAGLGVKSLIVTNAAGGVNRSYNVGDLVVISDHIGFPILAGNNPLYGPNDKQFGGPRFLPISDAYDPALRQLVVEAAKSLKLDFVHRSGTYAFVSGPTYESSGESLMLLNNGADTVGMSTIPEVIVARHCGMKVLCLSLVTNQVRLPGDVGEAASHEEVLETVNERSTQIEELVTKVLDQMNPETFASLEENLTANAASEDASGPTKVTPLQVMNRVKQLDINNMTPVQAMAELQKLKDFAEGK